MTSIISNALNGVRSRVLEGGKNGVSPRWGAIYLIADWQEIGHKSPAFWLNITVQNRQFGLVQMLLCAFGSAGWRTKPTGRMNHIAQMCLESTVRYLGIEVDDALNMAEQIEL
jgi:hypothetical protein